MNIKIVTLAFIVTLALFTGFVSATPIDDLNEMANLSKQVRDWRTYENFNGNVQLYVDGEPYYMTVENKTIQAFNDETQDYDYKVYVTEKDLTSTKELLTKYIEKGETLGVFDRLKLLWIMEKSPIYNYQDAKLTPSVKIGMAVSW